MEHERNQFAAQDALRSMRANLRQALPREQGIVPRFAEGIGRACDATAAGRCPPVPAAVWLAAVRRSL
jgi:hypothetical protein